MGDAQELAAESEDRTVKEAEGLANQGEWRKAALILGNAGAVIPLSPEALGTQAFYHSRAGDYEKAIALYHDLCALHPKEARWHYGLGYQYLQLKKWDQAIAALELALQLAAGWIKLHLSLGQAYESAGRKEKALETYRNARELYKQLPAEARLRLVRTYCILCRETAMLLQASTNAQREGSAEVLECLCEAAEAEPNDADSWYRLGSYYLVLGRVDEALQYLVRAEALAPRKEYICHKLAQAHLKKGNIEEALNKYEKVPAHRQTPYILRGIGQCLMAKGEHLEAAKKHYQAVRKEPEKFYHHLDLALALIELKAKEQAIGALDIANRLFEKEHGKSNKKILAKMEEACSLLTRGDNIDFESMPSQVTSISLGTVTRYDSNRAFGFIKDRADGVSIFFHISRVKDRATPQIGSSVKFAREHGEKGPQASWVRVMRPERSI